MDEKLINENSLMQAAELLMSGERLVQQRRRGQYTEAQRRRHTDNRRSLHSVPKEPEDQAPSWYDPIAKALRESVPGRRLLRRFHASK